MAEPEDGELTTVATSLRAARAFGRHRLGRRLGARLGALAAFGVALVYGLAASTGTDLAAESNQGLVAGALRWAAWLGAGPLTLAAARDDDDPGLASLARLAGLDVAAQARGQGIAAAAGMALRVAAPAWVVCVAGAVRSPSLGWAALAVGGSAAAIAIGAILAAVAVGAARLAPGRGRSLVLVVILVPFLASYGAADGWSLPGGLGVLIDALTGRYVP